MKDVQSPDKSKIRDAVNRSMSGPYTKGKINQKGLVSIIVESALVGFALFSAFLIQKIFFGLDDGQFLIGQAELVRMSIGIAFCYAFVSVLRRAYLYSKQDLKKGSAKLSIKLVAEAYVFYLALLFMVKDINFTSAKIALGIGFVLSIPLIILYRLFPGPNLFRRKAYPARRKITLKKPSPSVLTDRPAIEIKGESAKELPISHPEPNMDISRLEKEDIESPRGNRLSTYTEYSEK